MPAKNSKKSQKSSAFLTRVVKDHHMYLGIAVVVAIFVITYTVMFIEAMKKPPLNLSVSLSGGNTYQTEPDHYVLRNRLENSVAIALNITTNQDSRYKNLQTEIFLNDKIYRVDRLDSLKKPLTILYKELPQPGNLSLEHYNCITKGYTDFITQENCPEQIDFNLKIRVAADQESWEKFLTFSWHKTNENFCRASNFDAHNCAEDYPWEYCAIEANTNSDFCYDYREKQKQKELEKQKAEEKKQQEEKRRQEAIRPNTSAKISDCDTAYSLGLEDASEANLDSEYYGHKVNYYDYMRDKSEFSSACYSAYEKGFYANYGR